MNKIETILSKIGKDAKAVVVEIFGKILPGAVKVAQEAEPAVGIAAAAFGVPSLGAEFKIVVDAVAAAETAGALAEGTSGVSSEQKMAMVLESVTPKLLPVLNTQGFVGDAATATITKYAQAVVDVLNTFPAPVAAAPAPAAPAPPAEG